MDASPRPRNASTDLSSAPLSWSDEQEQLRSSLIRFATEELNDGLEERDARAEFSAASWARCAAVGIQGLPVPPEFGGGGAQPATIALALEALGYGCRDNGLLFSLSAQLWSCELPLVRFGSHDQKTRYLPGLCDGSLIGVQAMTEPDAGSDAYALTTTAQASDRGWVLNGTKVFITNAPVADMFVAFATLDRELGLQGLCAFVVDRDAPGLSVGPQLSTMGLRTSPLAEVTFSDCEIPREALLGREGGGFAVFNAAMDWERTFILAPSIGTMQRQLEACIAYARDREQFGQPIGKFEAVANRVVDMKLRLETSRLLLHDVARRKVEGRSSPLESSMVKLHLSECFVQSSLDAVQIHGGYGYTTEAEFERDVRDAIASRIYSGTSEIQRGIIASRLGL